jgi:hypothetical protein
MWPGTSDKSPLNNEPGSASSWSRLGLFFELRHDVDLDMTGVAETLPPNVNYAANIRPLWPVLGFEDISLLLN